ncbi:MAG: hypothetical protein ACREIA_26465 [Opitutaceae bacterium]
MRIVIVKADRFLAESIERVGSELFPSADIALYHTAETALAQLRSRPAETGVFGLTLPDMDGLDLLAHVVDERLANRRLIVSWRRDERARHVLRRIGVHGICESSSGGLESLALALRRVAAGHAYFCPESGGNPDCRARETTLDQILSDSELRVLAVIGDGSDDRMAGACLAASRRGQG